MSTSVFDPSAYPSLTDRERVLVRQISEFTREFFKNPKFDSSHDINHVMRVVSNSIQIMEEEQKRPVVIQNGHTSEHHKLSPFIIIAGAFLHDVDDKKYVDQLSGTEPLAKQELLRLGMDRDDSERIQKLIDGVSYSSESKNPERVQALVHEIPELAVVQDADRLDAIGAIGIARCFTFGGAKRARTLESSVDHFYDKLLKLEGMMKTDAGRRMAAERTKRLRDYLNWWQDEADVFARWELHDSHSGELEKS